MHVTVSTYSVHIFLFGNKRNDVIVTECMG